MVDHAPGLQRQIANRLARLPGHRVTARIGHSGLAQRMAKPIERQQALMIGPRITPHLILDLPGMCLTVAPERSAERRVGKECDSNVGTSCARLTLKQTKHYK